MDEKLCCFLSMCLQLNRQAPCELVCFPTSNNHSLIISVNRKTSTKQIAWSISSTNKPNRFFLFSSILSATKAHFCLSLCMPGCVCFYMFIGSKLSQMCANGPRSFSPNFVFILFSLRHSHITTCQMLYSCSAFRYRREDQSFLQNDWNANIIMWNKSSFTES